MERKYLLSKSLKRAQITRLLAKLIDLFIVLLVSVILYPFGIFLALGYLAICDSINNGQSVGKKFMGFSVVSLKDGKPCTKYQSFIRNLPIFAPMLLAIIPVWGWIFALILTIPFCLLEVYLIYKLDSAHRLGDVMADTTVVPNTTELASIAKASKAWFPSQKITFN